MLKCEGYQMFKGSAQFIPRIPGAPAPVYHGTWLYRPDVNHWFLSGCPDYPFGTSFPADRIGNIKEDEYGG